MDTETGLVYFGRRYYLPSHGRWLTEDPEGFIDGPNLYAYVKNRTLRYVDPTGLRSNGERLSGMLRGLMDCHAMKFGCRFGYNSQGQHEFRSMLSSSFTITGAMPAKSVCTVVGDRKIPRLSFEPGPSLSVS